MRGVLGFQDEGMTGFPGIGDRAFWEGLPEDVRAALCARGERALTEEIPVLTLSDYTEFSRNGNRVHFEEKFFKRRMMLVHLVLAECTENRGRFSDRIRNLMWAILEESTWCLPAHNSYVRDTPPFALPDITRPVIDLFAAETAAIVGLAEYLLRSHPGMEDAETDGIRDRIDAEIEHRILRPYLSYHFWWMGDGEQSMCNWTPWITQNVLLALFTRRSGRYAKEDLQSAFDQAVESVEYYLADYGEDGCCNEGAFYYGHSGLCLFGCYDAMNRITDGAMQEVWQRPLVRNIAAYIGRMYIGAGQYFNYSDASPYAGSRSARDYLFGKYTGNTVYAAFAAGDFRAQTLDERLMREEENLYYHLLQLACWREMEECPPQAEQPEDAWFESTGLMTARDGHWSLAAKAGDNGDSHNHNDIGSVTLYIDAKPFLIDLGVETYTAKTFSDRRYEIWTMQSAYHNTVNFITNNRLRSHGRVEDSGSDEEILPDILQRDGKEYAAREVRCLLSETQASLEFKMAGAYADPRVKECHRIVNLRKGVPNSSGTVTIRDHIRTTDGVRGVLTFMTYEKPEIRSDPAGRVRIRVGDIGTMTVSGIRSASIETCPITDPRLRKAWKHDCYRILLLTEGEEAETVIESS